MTRQEFEQHYQLKEYIGGGGFGKVYKARDVLHNHFVAVKAAEAKPELKQFTLQREVELVNKLPYHANVARYEACYRFEMGMAMTMDYAILKYYEYGNLEQFLKDRKDSNKPLTSVEMHDLVRGILRGVGFLHQHNIIHRDLKPQNILIDRENGVWVPKITDFGLSREVFSDATVTNSSVGISYAYAAPEQIQNRPIRKNVDLWAVGAMIYRIIADESLFSVARADSGHQAQIEVSQKILNLDFPEKLYTLAEPYKSMILRCLILDTYQRVQSTDELLKMLDGDAASSQPYYEEKTTVLARPMVAVGATTIVVNPAFVTNYNRQPAMAGSGSNPFQSMPNTGHYATPNAQMTQVVAAAPVATAQPQVLVGNDKRPERPAIRQASSITLTPQVWISLVVLSIVMLFSSWFIFNKNMPKEHQEAEKTDVAALKIDPQVAMMNMVKAKADSIARFNAATAMPIPAPNKTDLMPKETTDAASIAKEMMKLQQEQNKLQQNNMPSSSKNNNSSTNNNKTKPAPAAVHTEEEEKIIIDGHDEDEAPEKWVADMPLYNGAKTLAQSDEALLEYAKKLNIQSSACSKNAKVILTYIIEKDGTVGNFSIIRSACTTANKDIISALKGSMKKWKPAMKEGKAVRFERPMEIVVNRS